MPDHIDKYTDQQEAAYARKIAATYKKAAQEVRRQITEFTAKHKAKAAKLLQQVNAGEISMADYQAWLQGQVFIGKQWQDKLDDIVRVYTDADEKARQLMRGTVRDVFTESANYAAYQLEDRLGAAVDFHLYDAKTVDRLMRTNPQMLPEWKINEKKDYTWNEERVRSTLTRAIIQGKPIPDIADELGQQLATGNAKKMVLFARTAMTGAQNAGRVERLHDTQQMGIRVKKKWLAAHDARVRDTHAYLDGQERDVDDDFTVGGMHIAYPGDPMAPPELVYNCRCTMIYVYPEHQAEHEGEKTESYEEWLEEKRGKKEEQAPAENVTEERPADVAQAIERARQTTLQMYEEAAGWAEDNVGYMFEDAREKWAGHPAELAAIDAFETEIPQYMEDVREAVDRFDFSTRTDSYSVCRILEDGRFKSQIETGATHGHKDIDLRIRTSDTLFAYGEHMDIPRDSYEIYGYLDNAGTASIYGDCRIVLKKDRMIDRTTLTLGDSLVATVGGADPFASMVTDPRITSLTTNLLESSDTQTLPQRLVHARSSFDRVRKDGTFGGDYIELQFHGGVTLDDIDFIEVPVKAYNADELKAIAERTGVKIKWMR